MDDDTMEKGWQELQNRIEQLHRKYFGSLQEAIEHKPGEVLHLLDAPLELGKEYSGMK